MPTDINVMYRSMFINSSDNAGIVQITDIDDNQTALTSSSMDRVHFFI